MRLRWTPLRALTVCSSRCHDAQDSCCSVRPSFTSDQSCSTDPPVSGPFGRWCRAEKAGRDTRQTHNEKPPCLAKSIHPKRLVHETPTPKSNNLLEKTMKRLRPLHNINHKKFERRNHPTDPTHCTAPRHPSRSPRRFAMGS